MVNPITQFIIAVVLFLLLSISALIIIAVKPELIETQVIKECTIPHTNQIMVGTECRVSESTTFGIVFLTCSLILAFFFIYSFLRVLFERLEYRDNE